VQDILGPMCFDYGLVRLDGVHKRKRKRLRKTDELALVFLEEIYKSAPKEIQHNNG